MNENFRAERSEHVLTVTFGSPEARNVMNEAWFCELEQRLFEAQQDEQTRVVVLRAQGEAFCAGGDLRGFQAGPLPEGYVRSAFARLLMRLDDFDKPIVAAVHGSAIGGGTTLLLHCDFAFAAAGTTFQLPFTKLGLVPEFGSSYLLPLHAGMRLANELVLLAQPFDAEKALRAGIVNEVLPPDALMARANATAAALAALPPASMRASKRLLRMGHRAGLAAAMAAEGKALETCFAAEEMQEAIAAFFARREPDFSRFS
ncbi:enoyl-CoA hydratase-related protein [Cupriavidus necator]|uniref:enoyl-CoA hydratase/isomerase family protein n=1 Tax=Cupriavidus necator TaxID=106590 RepID=UPI003ED0052A